MKRTLRVEIDVPEGCDKEFKRFTKSIDREMGKYFVAVKKKLKKLEKKK